MILAVAKRMAATKEDGEDRDAKAGHVGLLTDQPRNFSSSWRGSVRKNL